ncbi:MAG: peroxidase [Gemmatimonadota bacterium]
MPFIRTIPPAEAEGPVQEMYEQARGRYGYVPNWAQVFSLRPQVRDGWVALLTSITANLPVRTYELATLAAARGLKSSYCSLAHASVLANQVFDAAAVASIAEGSAEAPLTEGERAMMAFVERLVRGADQITAADVEVLRSHGYSDAEIFDIVAAACARCFFSTLLDALGVQADASYRELDPALRQALTVGRPIAEASS